MKPILLLVVLLVGAGNLCAQTDAKKARKPETARERYEALIKEYQSAQSEWSKAYEKAKTDEERSKLRYPSASQYADRFLAIANDQPADPAALDALVWVATQCRDSKEQETSLDLLLKDHLQSTNLGAVASALIYARPGKAESWLRAVLKDSPHREVKACAAYSLGRQLLSEAGYAESLRKDPKSERGWLDKAVTARLLETGPEALRAEAEKLFEDIAANYSDVKIYKRTMADSAKSELFELRNLAIGKVAPDIIGADVDGKKFKLSDYRGKVVAIDFWGDW